jgi:hypothetical protein
VLDADQALGHHREAHLVFSGLRVRFAPDCWPAISRNRKQRPRTTCCRNRGKGGKGRQRIRMRVGELAKRVGRSVDTIKRWEEEGLLSCDRDRRGCRSYDESHVEACRRLADLGLLAQRRSEKLAILAAAEPVQLSLLVTAGPERIAS